MKHKHGIVIRILRVLAVVLAIALIGFGYFAYKQGVVGVIHRELTLPSCGNGPQFATLPVNPAAIKEVTPLGNVNVPGHTLPTDHMYFYFNEQNTPTKLISPGRIVVTDIELSGSNDQSNHQSNPGDYSVTFMPCRGLKMEFAHIKTLSGKVADAVANNKWSCEYGHQAQGIETKYCNRPVDLTLEAGDPIGTVGVHGQVQGMDFGAYKDGYHDPGLADSSWNKSNAVCGLDYFNADSQKALYAKIKRQSKPRCGQVGQDIAGTAQGTWSYDKNSGDWNGFLALVHYNENPAYGILAVGGKISQPLTIVFMPTNSGTVNRDPSQVRTGNTYCYQTDKVNVATSSITTRQSVLLRLTSAKTIQAEVQDGRCSASTRLQNPTTYYR